MAQADDRREPDELTAYRAVLKEAERLQSAVQARPPPAQPNARIDAALDDLAALQQRLTARAQLYVEIHTGARDFATLDWQRLGVTPATPDAAKSTLAAENLADYRHTLPKLAALTPSSGAPLAPIDAQRQDQAARNAEHLFPDRMVEPVPLPQLGPELTQEQLVRQRVTAAHLAAEQPEIRQQLSPIMQERAREAGPVPPTSLERKQRDFEQRQSSDAAREDRFARARENERPQYVAHAEARADNEGLAEFMKQLAAADPDRAPVPDPAPAPAPQRREGYQPLSADVQVTQEVTPADVRAFADQLAAADPAALDAPTAHGSYTALGVYHSPDMVEVKDYDAPHASFADELAAVEPSAPRETTDRAAAKQEKDAARTGVTSRTAGQAGAVAPAASDQGRGGQGGAER